MATKRQSPRGMGWQAVLLTISDRCQFQDGVKGTLQVGHFL
jgi:hypothetical protein